MTVVLPWVSLAVVLASLVVSVLSYIRAGQWKEGDDAASLIRRVGQAESSITTLQTQMGAVATREDVAAIRAEIAGLASAVRTTERGVERIEDHLIKERA